MTSAHEPAQALGRLQPAAKGLPAPKARDDCVACGGTAGLASINICPTENDGTRRHKSSSLGRLSSQSRQADSERPPCFYRGRHSGCWVSTCSGLHEQADEAMGLGCAREEGGRCDGGSQSHREGQSQHGSESGRSLRQRVLLSKHHQQVTRQLEALGHLPGYFQLSVITRYKLLRSL